jgi:tRNA uridine 5-carbamoylmethylation protein Kti12
MAAVLGTISTEVKIYVRSSIDLDMDNLYNEYHWEEVIQALHQHYERTAPVVRTDTMFFAVKTDMNRSPRENCDKLMEAARHTTMARNGQQATEDLVMMTLKESYKGTNIINDLIKSNARVSLEETLISMDGQYQV